jgi:hypothetical protein
MQMFIDVATMEVYEYVRDLLMVRQQQLRGMSSSANYTDRATAACGRS